MLPDAAIGPIIASTVAGAISLIGLIISKESKLSEFRQAWIDALREELATVVGHAHVLSAYAALDLQFNESNLGSLKGEFIEINRAAAKIEMRLNQKELESKILVSKMSHLQEMMFQRKPEEENLSKAIADVEAAAAVLLKKEWEVVKRGESTYKSAKIAALIVFLTGEILIIASLL